MTTKQLISEIDNAIPHAEQYLVNNGLAADPESVAIEVCEGDNELQAALLDLVRSRVNNNG